ncbi:hypothetical protein [Christensenella timonensis]|uniref:hypothetical protein n=1 Tax=Christensenella timonensis TaxID=1816678 RepID=UPI0008345454|nr:hypothetical protein [Christensenella timonensis]
MSEPNMQDIMDVLVGMNQRFDSIDKRFDKVDESLSKADERLASLENDVLALKLDNENVIKPAIQTIAENQTLQIKKLEDMQKAVEVIPDLEMRVDNLEKSYREDHSFKAVK